MKYKDSILTITMAFIAVLITYYINHGLGLGPFIANGTVGIVAALTLPKGLAAAAYTASFVGMSADFILPTFSTALISGIIAGIVILATKPIFAGWGGKGGTTAALAVLLTLIVVNYLPIM
ncbi:hypothetical protein [Natranaerobius thermophilus]|uniref:Uncharacterized protein n=1 Tax=Natranaerobius thermophilus (strain ATCC BAA-1301 / DSM 18059 / JW/NM-WN-LF) TaxID=457570 RepID=B2A3R1_NATTJ|nr:hypothetical protein [Natranaerobius thermophilus]ACB83687.1 conserved hypothetical protein [Natranaerobius thermophilus JW/NM-WN-LF]